MIRNSGDLVSVTEKESGKVVFSGHLLGANEKIIIGISLPFLNNPQSHIVSNIENIKHFKKNDIEDNLDCWLDVDLQYPSFNPKTHTITVLKSNETDFKADMINDVYDFKHNKWGEKRHGRFGNPSSVNDNPMKPIDDVIIECIGGENIYMIINGIRCARKCPNINGATYPFEGISIGKFNLVEDPSNPDMLNAVLIESYDAEYKSNILAVADIAA